jgi:predicted aspartyl protease
VTAFPFERSGDLMTIRARVWGPQGHHELLLVIDTGASATSVEPAILKKIGYSAGDTILRTRVPTPAGVQHGHLLRVHRFFALGADLSDFVVQALELADEYGVDGLLGMNFLEQFNFTVRPRDLQIHLEPVGTGESPHAS